MITETADTLSTSLPLWGLVIYTVYKDAKRAVEIFLEKKTKIQEAKAQTQKKDAESIRQDRIDETLLTVEKLLEILTQQQHKEINREQAEIILKGAFAVNKVSIIEHVAKTLTVEEINSAFIIADFVQKVETSYVKTVCDLDKFSFRGMPLNSYLSDKMMDEINYIIKEDILPSFDKTDIRKSHIALHSKLSGYYQNLEYKTAQKLN